LFLREWILYLNLIRGRKIGGFGFPFVVSTKEIGIGSIVAV